jgi:hypothetical protein
MLCIIGIIQKVIYFFDMFNSKKSVLKNFKNFKKCTFSDKPKPIDDSILKQIKYNFVHRERISSFLFGDIRGAKQSCEILCLPPDSDDGIKGYFQEIKLSPFGFILISDIQVFFVN